jgi:chloride channel 3/4/5
VKGALIFKKIHQTNNIINSKTQPILWVVFLTVFTAATCYTNLFTRIDAAELLENLFSECESNNLGDNVLEGGLGLCSKTFDSFTVFSLLIAIIIKLFFSTLSFGSMVPAGKWVLKFL